MASLYVSTTGTTVNIPELGISIVHPTTDRDLTAQFSHEELHLADSLTSAIQAGTLQWKKDAGGPVQPAANYDADFLEILHQREGTGIGTVRSWTLAASTIQLYYSSATVHIFSGSTPGQIVRLPIATTAELGREITIYNRGTVSIALQYQDGSAFFSIPASTRSVISLQDNSTANGEWFILQSFNNIASGIVNYNVIASTPFNTTSVTDVLITGFSLTPIEGKYAVFYSASNVHTTNNNQIASTVYAGGVAVPDSERTVQSVSANFVFLSQSQTVCNVNGAQTIDVRVRRSTNGTLTVNNRSMILIRLGQAS